MKRKLGFLMLLGISSLLLSGCYFNLFQTAKTLDRGRALLGIGLGVVPMAIEGETAVFITPQAQLGVGLADGVQLTLKAGALAALGNEPMGQFGAAVGELKFRLFDEPGAFAFALGFGGGWSVTYFGWGIHGSLYFDSNVGFLPVYLAWRPFVPLGGIGEDSPGGFASVLSGGLRLVFSERATLLLELDYHTLWQLLSPGMSLVFTF
ncbi:MAG: hypothetical protein GXO72_03265 [Caldiserica bacterium]|nr:hypothetical protein [Caldisericota bacterium]